MPLISALVEANSAPSPKLHYFVNFKASCPARRIEVVIVTAAAAGVFPFTLVVVGL